MQAILAGGTGFLGRALQQALQRDGHTVRLLTRQKRGGDEISWQPDGRAGNWANALDGADVVVNLAGNNLAGGRWTSARKRAIRDSRLLATRSLAEAIRLLSRPPGLLLSMSGAGYYGARGDELVTEATPPGTGFLAELCVDWERAAEQVSDLTRVIVLRTAVVLHPRGGALGKMLLPFQLGAGGRLGSGRQYFPWIHLDDWVTLVRWLMTTEARGAFNAAAPEPVTNAEYTRALSRALHRPAIIPVPAFALNIALGELASTLLTGQRVVPARALEMGFQFRFRRIDDALRDLLQ